MAVNSSDLGRTLAEIRKTRGITQRGLAEKMGLTPTFLSLVENGQRRLSMPALAKYASAVGIEEEFIIFLASDAKTKNKSINLAAESLKNVIREAILADSI